MKTNLTIENSWHIQNGLWDDFDLQRVKNSKLVYRPPIFESSDIQSNAILTLRGPRRSGKTVGVKLLIAELIESHGWSPQSIRWISFDTLRDLAQAEELLLGVLDAHSPRLLAVDEVTSLLGWQFVFKKLSDAGKLKNTCCLLTGSSALDLKKGAERMAGRRGSVIRPDRILLPMNFQEFATQLQQAGRTELLADPKNLQDLFLEVGGFPFRVDAFLKASHWRADCQMDVFADVYFYELARRKLDRSAGLEVLGRLADLGCGACSFDAFSKPLSLAKETARKHLEALGESFLLATLSSYDTARGRVAPKKDKKFNWVDPALGLLAQHMHQGKLASLAVRAEWVVGAELLRRFEVRLWEGLDAPRNVFTWRSASGKEIDFLVIDKSLSLKLPVEVKYQESVSTWDMQVIEKSFGSGLLISASNRFVHDKSECMTLSELSRYFEKMI